MLSSWNKRRGIRVRVGVFVFVTAFCALLLTSFFISRQMLDLRVREFDSQLYNLALDLTDEMGIDFFGNPAPPAGGLSFGKKSLPFPEAHALFQILDTNGQVLYHSAQLGTHRLPWHATDWNALLAQEVVFHTLSGEEYGNRKSPPMRLISIPIMKGPVMRGIFQMAVSTEIIERERQQLSGLFAFLIPILVGGLAFGSYWVSGRALLPLRELIGSTREIVPEKLSVRVPEPDTGDEVAELSQTLNGLLTRLQLAFESQERFIADASHQLKTPLAVMQGEIELLQQRDPSKEEIRQFLGSAHEEVQHLTKLVQGLLILARVSALPEASLVKTRVRLDEILLSLLERYQSAFRKREIKCRFQAAEEGEFEVAGDEDLLRSLFETLLENAIKYSPDGGVVEVKLEAAGNLVTVLICDEGKGIPEELRERVFERFYRADTRTHGFGLGLTIARQIIQAHGAEIRLEPRDPKGTCIRVEMKKNS
ncbi:MAG: sensor histidine kinase [Bdellovibrionia bacterium]